MDSKSTRAELDAEFEAQAPDWYHTYEKWAAYPLFVMGLMFLAAFAIQALNTQDPADQAFARVVIPLTWVAFALDYVIGFTLAKEKMRYVRSRPLQLVALIFPPLRLLLLGHVVTVLQKTASRADRAKVYLLFITTLTAFVSAILEVYFELRVPDSNIRSFGNAIWWVGETVSTVGYGDFYPVTVGGRIVAGVLFINGVALLSVITAGMAQRFVSDPNASTPAPASPAAAAAPTPSTASTGTAPTAAPAAPDTTPTPPPAPVAAMAGGGSSTTVSVSKEALTTLQHRIAGLEEELTTMREHVKAILGGSDDTPPASTN